MCDSLLIHHTERIVDWVTVSDCKIIGFVLTAKYFGKTSHFAEWWVKNTEKWKKIAEMKNVAKAPTEYEMQNSIKQIGNKIANTSGFEVGNSTDANGWVSACVCGRNSANINLKLIKYVEQTFRLPLLIRVCAPSKTAVRDSNSLVAECCVNRMVSGKWWVVFFP